MFPRYLPPRATFLFRGNSLFLTLVHGHVAGVSRNTSHDRLSAAFRVHRLRGQPYTRRIYGTNDPGDSRADAERNASTIYRGRLMYRMIHLRWSSRRDAILDIGIFLIRETQSRVDTILVSRNMRVLREIRLYRVRAMFLLTSWTI